MNYYVFINPPALVVDGYQEEAHASPYPYSFLKILSYYKSLGHKCLFIDMMYYKKPPFEKLPLYENIVSYIKNPTNYPNKSFRILGRDVNYLGSTLFNIKGDIKKFFITACLTYNYPIIWDIVNYLKKEFPKAEIVIGGFYPTWLPEHLSNLQVKVYAGKFTKADRCIPDYSVFEERPEFAIFRLIEGCVYKCSFCCNSDVFKVRKLPIIQVLKEIEHMYSNYGIKDFENWDPNVMIDKEFLKSFIIKIRKRFVDINLRFEMGIQLSKLDNELIKLFVSESIKDITLPLESSNNDMLKFFKKPYRFENVFDKIVTLFKSNFDFSRSHFTFMLGYPEDNIEGMINCYLISILSGGIPQPFPVTVSPKTLDYKRYYDFIKDKDLLELNGNLFPLARSKEEFLLKDKILYIFNLKDMKLARRELDSISSRFSRYFDAEYEKLAKVFKR